MTLVVGLDTGSRKWHAVDSDGSVAYDTVPKSVSTDEARLRLAHSWRGYAATLPADTWICCEEPLSLQNPQTNKILAYAANALWMATFFHPVIAPMTLRWEWIDVSQWKRVVLGDGNGNADKDQIAAWVLEHDLPAEPQLDVYEQQPDLYDARCLCNFGVLWLTTGVKPAILGKSKKRRKK